MLQLEDLTIYRHTQKIVENLHLNFEQGKIYTILGPNGAGKSSLLKAIFGEIPYQGKISYQQQFNQESLSKWQKSIGYMPQDCLVDASLNALEVILLGHIDKLTLHISDEHLSEVITLMQMLEISHLAHRDITTLSGGQRQLIMFAQALIKQPNILLLDEPVSALDMHHQLNLLEKVQQYTRKHQIITIMILHDLNLASQFSDKLILLGEGKLQAQGLPNDVLKQDIISQLYHIHLEILFDNAGLPVIRPLAKKPLN
ncbi:ABC transporter ATP-binding protein [Volucribacter amazonae]|uniref:Peptide ABC transporter substrate-binding protein n=1 Tax=Volucribacter amazonae TaxID=256731 RepID=A0A9X4PBH0_9PAST|nr:ABC transporter ATP-binding protein [Volucribacter amazonae]MDG6894579.1 peptide ABC transporter substrate-binding protein [Volucribacter amazonae]